MTDGSSQGLFVIVAVIIFGIFIFISYLLFRDTLKPSLAHIFTDGLTQAESSLSGTDNNTNEELFGNSKHKFGMIMVSGEETGTLLNDDIEQSGDALIGGVKLATNITDNSYDIVRTYKERVIGVAFNPELTAVNGIKTIELVGSYKLDVPDSEKMNKVTDILKNHGDVTGGNSGFLFAVNNGDPEITKEHPYSQSMKVTDTKGNVFTINITIQVQ